MIIISHHITALFPVRGELSYITIWNLHGSWPNRVGHGRSLSGDAWLEGRMENGVKSCGQLVEGWCMNINSGWTWLKSVWTAEAFGDMWFIVADYIGWFFDSYYWDDWTWTWAGDSPHTNHTMYWCKRFQWDIFVYAMDSCTVDELAKYISGSLGASSQYSPGFWDWVWLMHYSTT